MCGKNQTMLDHLVKCESATQSVKEDTRNEQVTRKNGSTSATCHHTSNVLPNDGHKSNLVTSSKEPLAKYCKVDGIQQKLTGVV